MGVTTTTGVSQTSGFTLPSVPGGTNTFLPTTNFAPGKPVQYAYTTHFTPVGGVTSGSASPTGRPAAAASS